jgi:hypothetical protein
MRLDEVMPGVPAGAESVDVSDLADDRQVQTGALLFFVSGFTRDGPGQMPRVWAGLGVVPDHVVPV